MNAYLLISLLSIGCFFSSHTIAADSATENITPEESLKRAQEFMSKELYASALQILTNALERFPDDVSMLFQYSLCAFFVGEVKNSLNACDRLARLLPQNPQVMYNYAYLLKSSNKPKESINWYHKALSINPTYVDALWGLSLAHLACGNFAIGWRIYEHQLKRLGRNAPELRTLIAQKQLAGKTIVLAPEGGLGDVIMFSRCGQLLRQQGAYVIMSLPRCLMHLFKNSPCADTYLEPNTPLPPHDAFSTLMSLPAILNLDETTIPTQPYIHTNPERSAFWHDYFASEKRFKIGICWQVSIANDKDRMSPAKRGIPLPYLAQLAQNPRVALYSLQQVDGVEDVEQFRHCITTFDVDFDKKYGAFIDTAAVMKELDLVISVDTATAHLAGALGVRTWLLLPFASDWRWLAGRRDSPWYPTMTIFQQSRPFDWEQVMRVVRKELQLLLAHDKSILRGTHEIHLYTYEGDPCYIHNTY